MMTDHGERRESQLSEQVARLRARVAELERERDELKGEEQSFRSVADNSPNMIFISAGGRVVYANKRCSEVMGYSNAELTDPAFDFRRLIAPDARDIVEANLRRHLQGHEVGPYEYALITRDGRRLEAIHTTKLIDFRGQRAIVGVATDVTERVTAELALRESEARYRTLMETSPDPIVAISLRGDFRIANRRTAELFGYATVDALLEPPKNILEHLHEDDRERGRADALMLVGRGGPFRLEYRMLRHDGSGFRGEISASVIRDGSGAPTGFVVVIRDLTVQHEAESERRRLEAQVQHAQRLESLGVLAGGIAHDFNNLLVGILGNATLASAHRDLEPSVAHSLTQIEAAARRAADLTRQMLAYAGKGAFNRERIDLRDLVLEMSELLVASIPKKTTIDLELDDASFIVEADRGGIQQVIMNLITNAADAMEETGGVIRLSLALSAASALEGGGPFHGSPLVEGRYVCLAVSDTGCGMDAETQERIFDPFFTTKFAGRGLGLATVLGMVRGHGGALTVDSAPGAGTTFRLLLPASEESLARPVERAFAAPSGDDAVPREGVALVADDEEIVRVVVRRVLERLGFTVLSAENGLEAVELALAHGDELVLALLDLTMPVMDGLEALERIREALPDLPVILSSGYTELELAALPADDRASFIQKPYPIGELTRAVAIALGEEQGGA